MNKEENRIVPAIRFPKFENDGDWEIKKLSKLGHLINGLTYSPKDVRDEGLLVLRSSNVQDGKIVLDDNVFVRPDIKGANISKSNDILICVRNGSKALIGKNAILPENLPYSTHGAFMTMFRAKNPKFTFQLFQTEAYDRQVKADLGATINSINGKNFIKYEFVIPPNPAEQQKIAACLSSLDEVITAESEKLDLLQDHKKGLLQQLFPAEGETVPKFRFPEFKDDGDWEEKELKNLILNISPPKKLKSNQFNESGKYPIVDQSQNEIAGWTDDDEAIIKIDFPTVVFGDHTCILKIIEKPFVQGADGIKIFKGNKRIDTRYLFYALQSNPLIMKEYKRHYSILKEKVIIYPDIKTGEQQKIAACLSAADDLLAAQAQKIEALQDHKKGLLQQLFPNLNELAV